MLRLRDVETYDLKTVLRRAVSTLKKAGIEDAAADSRILAAENFGLRREDMLRSPDMLLDCVSVSAFERSIARRRLRMNRFSRILGRREFRSLDFEIGPATLDPRPDSETIVEAVLDVAADMKPDLRVLDIGTGSGCLLLSILHELPAAHGWVPTSTRVPSPARVAMRTHWGWPAGSRLSLHELGRRGGRSVRNRPVEPALHTHGRYTRPGA